MDTEFADNRSANLATTRRFKRRARAAGLLAVLSLAVSGCGATASPAPAVTSEAPAVTPSATSTGHQNQVADFDPTKIAVDKTYIEAFGKDAKRINAIAKDGIRILSVMYGEHPEYTVHGFVPTEDHWKTISAKLTPLVNDTAFSFIKDEWETMGDLPVLTAHGYGNGKDGEQDYTITDDSGEKCTDSDRPYEVDLTDLDLKAMTDGAKVMRPWLSGALKVTVFCQQGGRLEGIYGTSFLMEKQGDKWLMTYGYEAAHREKFKVVK